MESENDRSEEEEVEMESENDRSEEEEVEESEKDRSEEEETENDLSDSDEDNVSCIKCNSRWGDDEEGQVWIECNICNKWVHERCLSSDYPFNSLSDIFYCPACL